MLWKPQAASTMSLLLCAAVLIIQSSGFTFTRTLPSVIAKRATTPTPISTSTTVLFPHSFSAYDASESSVNAKSWTPSQAAEFVVWHIGEHKQTGMQLSPMIQNWSGDDLGEFLSRLFLGKVNADDDNKISYCPSNVRTPMWLGLEDEGVEALKELLLAALPETVLSPEALARCAQSFLLKEHRWPVEIHTVSGGSSSSNNTTNTNTTNESNAIIEYEQDSFASRGFSKNFATILGYVRKERLGEFTANDVVRMLSLPEHSPKDQGYTKIPQFFTNLGISLTQTEKVQVVEQLALAGWAPSNLAKFVCSIAELQDEAVRTPVAAVSSANADGTTTTSSISSTSTSSMPQTDSLPSSSFVPLQPPSSVVMDSVNNNPLR